MHISLCAEMTVQADSDIKPDAQGGIAIRLVLSTQLISGLLVLAN
jgi:hypothetical protein